MSAEVMDLEELARFLQRDLREVTQLANRGYLPGRKVGGQWRFSRIEITHWVENQMHAFTEEQLATLEGPPNDDLPEFLVGAVLTEACMAVPLEARTRSSVLQELVSVAERSWQVYDPEALLLALKQREEMGATALENGVAIPHPRRPLPNALGENLIGYGRTFTGIPFGAPHGILTDIYFLVCSRDDRAHLRMLARLSRLLLRPGTLDELRAAESALETFQVLEAAEREIVGR
jgi:PTS system nitrogen regulatory IIA component